MDAVQGSQTLDRVLSFENLLGFGVASIMGSGGFNLIGHAIICGGYQFPIALGATAALFQGTSLTYEEAYNEFKTNTSESDLIEKEFGPITSNISSAAILAFNLISTSVVLVICAKLLFPSGSWSGQISFALLLLSGITVTALKGIKLNKEIITVAGLSIAILLGFASMIGLIELGAHGIPSKLPTSLDVKPSLVHSFLYFYFVLAGFDALMKFSEESKDPDNDLGRSFYASNAISTLLTIGVCFAFLMTFTTQHFNKDENIVARIVGAMLGSTAEQATSFVSIVLMIVTGFVCFLASTRYMFSLATEHSFASLRELNKDKAPWKAILLSTIVVFVGVLSNNVYTLVKFSDVALTITLLLVSAAATRMQLGKGKQPWIEGMTTTALGALLSACIMYR